MTTQNTRQLLTWLTAGLLLTVMVASTRLGRGQQAVIGKVKNFSVSPEFYDPPNQAQAKAVLRGAEAQPLAGGQQILISNAFLQTFREDGTTELQVEAPECLYDSRSRSVNSAGLLLAKTADGKFSLQGEGFTWQPTNSTLLISNNVRTLVDPEVLQHPDRRRAVAEEPREPPIEITSREFEYVEKSGLGIYRGEVRVAGTNLAMSGGVLTIEMPVTGKQLQSISAKEQVTVDYGGVHATGGWVLYTADTGLVQVWGKPAWKSQQREGGGDELTIDPTNRVFLARGNSWLRLPGRSLAGSGLLSPAQPDRDPDAGTEVNFVEIRSDNYEFRTNWAVFRQAVRVTEGESGSAQGTMTCGELTVRFEGTNEVQELAADQNVVISQEDKRFRAARAVYHGTNGVLELTGEPTWQAGPRGGQGEVLLVKSREEEMVVRGNASMRLPAKEFGQLTTPGATEVLPALPATAGFEFADIFSEQYTLSPKGARFTGGVYISHPQMNWACEELTVQLPEAGGTIEEIVAEDSVSFDLMDRQGQKVHGVGQRAVYTYKVLGGITNDFIELTGDPVLETTNGIFRNSVIILDRANHQLIAPGHYRIGGWGRFDKSTLLAPVNRAPAPPGTTP